MYEVLYIVLVAAAAVLILSPVLSRSGWPLNEGSTAPLLLVQIYAAHFRHLDFFPVWSSSDGIGMGTPVVLYYHRTFYYVAGLIYLLSGGHLKFAVVATIIGFLAIGAYGMRAALGVVTTSRLLCTVGSVGFLFTNYVFTDWLDPRGDLAEFSALMIVPWLLYWCLTLVKHRRMSFVIVPVMVALVNSHSGIALLSVFVLLTALASFVRAAGFRGFRDIAVRLVISIAATLLLLAPLFLAELKFSQYYDPQTKNTNFGFKVSQQFRSFWSYFFDGSHRWLAPNTHYFVQIDFAIWVPIAVATITYVALTIQHRDWKKIVRALNVPVVMFLVTSLLVYMFLQLRISLFVYQVLAPLQVVNFPWRMLAFITPIGIIVAIQIADGVMRRYPSKALWLPVSCVWLASLLLLSPVTSGLGYTYGYLAVPGRFPYIGLFTAPKFVDYQTYTGFFLGSSYGPLYGDFLPKVMNANGSELHDDLSLYTRLHQHDAGAESLGPVPCTVTGPPHAEFETLQLRFKVSCDGATRLALPISFNGSSTLFVESARGTLRRIPYVHVRTDPRIIINVTSSQPETVVVHLPTLWGTLF